MVQQYRSRHKLIRLDQLYHEMMLALSSPGEDVLPLSAPLTCAQYMARRQRLRSDDGTQVLQHQVQIRKGIRFGDLCVFARQAFHGHFPPGQYKADTVLQPVQQRKLLNAVLSALDQHVCQEMVA